jgi:uncharacterized protein (TIGR04255 family)
MKLPTKIDPCPIISAGIEFRFNPVLPPEAIFGVIYEALAQEFPYVTNLPIVNVPQSVRYSDPNLKYQPERVLNNNNSPFRLYIGPKVFSLSCIKPYSGWKLYFEMASKIIESLIVRKKIITQISRLGLRYVNFFEEENIIDKLNLKILVNDESKNIGKIELKYIETDEQFDSQVFINNCADTIIMGKKNLGSIIDIDTYCVDLPESESNGPTILTYLNSAHLKEKTIFFGLLKNEYLKQFNPEYDN